MSEASWYVVHTYSGYENKVKANIEKTIENRHLEDQILEVRVPMQDVVELKDGASRSVQKKMFPGYVLINMIMNDDTWYVVRNTRGVTGFVGPGSKPVPLTEEEMRPLGIHSESVQIDFAEGDSVVSVTALTDQRNIVLQTKAGFFLRFAVDEIPEKKKGAIGVRGMKLGDGDQVENVYYTKNAIETTIEYKGKELVLNNLKLGKRDSKGTKVRV